MQADAKYTLVGAVVLILIALMVGGIVWLRASGAGKDDAPYRIDFQRQSLDGLEIRSAVTMRGVQVGTVTGIGFSAKRSGVVEVMISVVPSTPVRESTRAVVDRNLITGLATIRLLNLNETSALLMPTAGDGKPTVIGEGESQLEQVSETLNQLTGRAEETMRRINTALSDKNLAAFASSMDNLNRLLRDSDRSLGQLDRTLASIDAAANKADALGDEAIGATRQASSAAQQIGQSASQVAGSADQLIANSNVQVQLTAQEIRAAADALGVATRKYSHPRTVLFGPPRDSLGPGEARP